MKTIEETVEFIEKMKELCIIYKHCCKVEMNSLPENDKEHMFRNIYSETKLINRLDEILNFIQEENK